MILSTYRFHSGVTDEHAHRCVGIDIGSARHRVAVGLPDGKLIDEFDIDHHAAGFQLFFARIALHEARHQLPVMVAMEGYNGWTRPLDGEIRRHGWPLYNVNNLKRARSRGNKPSIRLAETPRSLLTPTASTSPTPSAR